jgi:alkanesulfonate monooxygenase SsuD/methylene tetrahydromethanopterin reductase-like flavin-dependent oxidoreductase (luciferase family)
MAITGKRYWGVLTPRPAAQIVELAKQAETMGLEGIWGIQLLGPPFLPLATAAADTERLKLGTGVALAFTRSPLETAMSALDLDIISGGRVVLGVGPSVQFINEHWHGVLYGKPLPHLREAVTLIRLIMEKGHRGKLGKWQGTYYTVDFSGFNMLPPPVRPRIPLYLSALFVGAVRLAAEVADGIAGHPIWSLRWIRDQVVPNLTAGLKRANKTRQSFDLNIWAYAAINKDRRQAIEDARGAVASYASISQYEKYFAAQGFGCTPSRCGCAASRPEGNDHSNPR